MTWHRILPASDKYFVCSGSCIHSVTNTLKSSISGTKLTREFVIAINIHLMLVTAYESPCQNFLHRNHRYSFLSAYTVNSIVLHLFMSLCLHTQTPKILFYVTFPTKKTCDEYKVGRNIYTVLITDPWTIGQALCAGHPQSCQCVRGGVWRRLMKVLCCRIGLMALGFTLSPRWQWEHSAIILSLSLLLVDHSCVGVLQLRLWFLFIEGWLICSFL